MVPHREGAQNTESSEVTRQRRKGFHAEVKEHRGTSVVRFAIEYRWYRAPDDWSWGIVDDLSYRAAVALAEDMQAAFLSGANLITPSGKHRYRIGPTFTCKEAPQAALPIKE